MKYILCDTPKGQYKIPLKAVAEHRANHYAIEIDGHTKDSLEYKNEVLYCMTDGFEGIDWILNNTNWEDWEDIAVKVNDSVNVTDEVKVCITYPPANVTVPPSAF